MDVKNYRDSSSFHKPRFVRITNRKAFDFGECSPNRGLSFYLCRNMSREKIIRVTVPKSFYKAILFFVALVYVDIYINGRRRGTKKRFESLCQEGKCN